MSEEPTEPAKSESTSEIAEHRPDPEVGPKTSTPAAPTPPSRPPLEGLAAFGPRLERLESVERSSAGDTLAVKAASTGFTLTGTHVEAGKRTGLIFYERSGRHENVHLADVLVSVAPGTLEFDRAYWGVRGYDLVDAVFERVEITGFGVVTPKHDEGHAIYLNPLGSITIADCHLHHNGGQAIQLVRRPIESVEPEGPASGTITVRNTRLAENGFNPDRGAFQLSIFGTGQDVVLTDVEIIAGHDPDVTWHNGMTGGALLIESDRFKLKPRGANTWWRGEEEPAPDDMVFTTGRATLTRVRVHHRNPNRPIVQIKSCRELVVEDSDFAEGVIQLDMPKKAGRDSGSIRWTGNRGEATVKWRGETLGPAWRDFEIIAGQLQPKR